MTRTWALAALLFAAGCGTGTDGKPVAPPTTPEPVPPPEPPGQPTNVRVVDRGPDFIVWAWDRVESATGYDADVFREEDAGERTRVHTREPSYQWTGLEPGIAVSIFLRAVRETAGGRAESPWVGRVTGYTLPPPPGPLAPCTDQRERALDYSWAHSQLVHDWNPDRPIRFRVDAGPIIQGGLRIGRPDFLEAQVLQPLRDMARRLRERLGYQVMESPDAGPGSEGNTVTVEWRDRIWSPGWDERCPEAGSPWNAQGTPPTVVLNRHIFDPEITCGGFDWGRRVEVIIHELAHTFGMGHSEGVINYVPEDLAMSEPLTLSAGGESDDFLLVEDLDNIGCVFPHPDYPR